MSIAEVCLMIMATTAVAIAAIMATFVVRVTASLRRAETLSDEATRSLRRLTALIGSTTEVVADVARVERRVGRVANVLLDEVEPPLRQAAAVLSGVRAGWGAWVRSRRPTDGGGRSRPEGGNHDREP